MFAMLERFIGDEDGAVTVDWVVLTAAVVGMGLGVILIFKDGPTNVGNTVSGRLDEGYSSFVNL